MTAPARAKGTAARKAKPEREKTKKTKQPGKAEKSSGRMRSTAAERAYARREDRRDRSLNEGAERRPRQQRQSAEEPQRRRVVRPKARDRAKQLQTKVVSSRAPQVVGVMALLGTGLVTTLWLSIAAVSGSYELQQAEAETSALNEQRELLLREVSNMDSTPALQRRAEELGLVPGPEPARLVLNPDGTTRLVGEPEEAKAPAPPPLPAPPAGPPVQAPGQQPGQEPGQEAARQAAPVPAIEAR